MLKINELLKATKGKLISGKAGIGIKGISIDSRKVKTGEAFIAIKGANFDGHDFIDEAVRKGASCIIRESRLKKFKGEAVRSKSSSIALIEVKDTIRALGDIARFWRKKFDVPVIAVSGSNGKTTTKEMISWVLSGEFKVLKNEGTKNNHIGLPLTLLNLSSAYKLVVVEVGTNHFGELGYLADIASPNLGIITNIGPAHLEYFKNLQGVFKEKYSLITHLESPYIAILNADDALLRNGLMQNRKEPVVFGFGIKNKSDFFASDIKVVNGKIEFLVNQKHKFTLKTLGCYNIYNALATIAVARIFGLEYQDIASALAVFNFPQGRLNFVELNNIKFINDTYNSNPASLKQALESLDKIDTKGRKIFVMGDMLELGKHKKSFHCEAGRAVSKRCNVFLTVGKLSECAAETARLAGFDIKNIFTCENSSEAKNILFNKIYPKPDDVVLVKGSRGMKMEEILEF